MKYFVVGMHSSGKQELFDLLEKQRILCGRLFANLSVQDIRYDYFSEDDIVSIFENKAYVFMKELDEYTPNSYEGLSLYEYDNNDVFILSPSQFNYIPVQFFQEDTCVVWLDNSRSDRKQRYDEERRTYNFNEVEEVEKRDMDDFIKTLYNTKKIHPLYFSNEDIGRVFAIVYSLVKHQELLPIYEKNFI